MPSQPASRERRRTIDLSAAIPYSGRCLNDNTIVRSSLHPQKKNLVGPWSSLKPPIACQKHLLRAFPCDGASDATNYALLQAIWSCYRFNQLSNSLAPPGPKARITPPRFGPETRPENMLWSSKLGLASQITWIRRSIAL